MLDIMQSVHEEEHLEAQHDARKALAKWAQMFSQRDGLIRYARRSGLTYVEIAQILGMGRGTVTMIANRKPGGPRDTARAERPAQQLKDDR